MDKLKMHSINKVDENVERIGKLFPNCVTETIVDDKLTKVIDFDMLKQELSAFVVEGRDERYQFTWPDKKKSILLANAPIAKTLRPCKKESVDFDMTKNLYIEGDNLDVLKLLQETYLGKVKVIYIDPPYNTGNDFVYEDDFAQNADEYLANSGQYDEEGNRLVQNNESNGRFHTDWLNMIYPRLKLAKDLLTDDGVIFISIDDNEVENLKKICNDIFGGDNFLATFVWKRRSFSAMDTSNCSTDHEYVLSYYKKDFIPFNGTEKDYKGYSNPDNDPRGPWTTGDLTVGMNGDMRPNQFYDLVDPKTGKVYKPNYNRVWSYIPESMDILIKENRIVFPEDTSQRPMKKRFASELKVAVNPFSTWMDSVGMNTEGTRLINSTFGVSLFNYAKPISLCYNLIKQASREDSLILDFFSGSATTAHAIMQLNAEDGGHRKFIMIQLPEETGEKSEAYKAGYKNICEIGKERIRRAGVKIKEEAGLTAQNLDIGFRVLKCDSSNMKEVYYSPSEYTPSLFSSLTDNIKEDRTPEDLLFQVMLDLGVLLSSKIEETTIAGKKVFSVADGYLIACFDEDITDETIKEIAQKKPYYFVMRDGGYASDSVATNFDQIFAAYSPSTIRKVL
jgi:adenine-specific DNA-methyltransferase